MTDGLSSGPATATRSRPAVFAAYSPGRRRRRLRRSGSSITNSAPPHPQAKSLERLSAGPPAPMYQR